MWANQSKYQKLRNAKNSIPSQQKNEQKQMNWNNGPHCGLKLIYMQLAYSI